MVREAIKNAVSLLRETASKLVSLTTWEEMDTPGRFIATEVLTSIDSSEFTIADISKSKAMLIKVHRCRFSNVIRR